MDNSNNALIRDFAWKALDAATCWLSYSLQRTCSGIYLLFWLHCNWPPRWYILTLFKTNQSRAILFHNIKDVHLNALSRGTDSLLSKNCLSTPDELVSHYNGFHSLLNALAPSPTLKEMYNDHFFPFKDTLSTAKFTHKGTRTMYSMVNKIPQPPDSLAPHPCSTVYCNC